MDIQAMQSMDWLFKKERIYLLAQFWQQRATLAEKEVTALKEQLAAANHSLQLVEKGQKPSDMEQTMDLLSRPSVEVELAAKEKEISQLVEDVQRLQSSLAKLQESSATQIARLEEQLDQKTQHIARLEARLETQRDYEEVKRELSILRSIEFPSLPGTGESSNKPLEMLLLERTKALQSENTALKVSNADLQDHLQRVKRDSEHQIQKLNEQRALIAQLEQDLSSVRSFATTSLYGGETEAALLSSDLVSGISTTPVPSSHGSSPAFGTSASPSATDTLLPIVQAQRERFKQINFELETLTQQQQQQISLLQSELEGVRSDNVKLYEKIRFLQSYPNRAAAAGPLAEGSTEQRYQSQYEAHLDPFSSFSRKERQRRYTQLSTFDKITLSMGQFFLSSPLARMITLLYFFMLHCLVFLALYQVAHTESCHRDMASECAERFAQHMQKVHGENVE